MSKFLSILALLALSVPALAQERQSGVGVSFSHSPGTGNADGLGIRFDLVLPVQDFFTVVAQTQWEREPKLYIGDDSGSAWRSRVEGRIHLADRQADISCSLSLFSFLPTPPLPPVHTSVSDSAIAFGISASARR
jgi:hypothetical protein